MEKLPISVIVLTFNEEKNIEDCLKSVSGWVEDIFIVDSCSTDNTLRIASRYTGNIVQHEFDDYASQRNWALNNLPINSAWIMNLDSDQRVSARLKDELIKIFASSEINKIDGFITNTKTVFLDKWVRHGGHYPLYRHYLFRKGAGSYEERKYHQHCIVKGRILRLKEEMVDVISSDIETFIFRVNRWSSAEAQEYLSQSGKDTLEASLTAGPIERKRWLKKNIYWRLPPILRVYLYFFYRFVIRLGFLDGWKGFVFHFIQGFLFNFLTDAKIWERRRAARMEVFR
jgi:glycosyltransferase involved in cell wall biosynthesis